MTEYKTFKIQDLGKTGLFQKIKMDISIDIAKYVGGFPEKVATGYIAREGSPDYQFFSEYSSLMAEFNPKNLALHIERNDTITSNPVYYISIPLDEE
jgi:hypothetical protein